MDKINQKIIELRKDRSWSQSKLARQAGLVPSAISMIEANQRFPSIDTSKKIATAFCVTIGYLMGENVHKHTSEINGFYLKYKILDRLLPSDKTLIEKIIEHFKLQSYKQRKINHA